MDFMCFILLIILHLLSCITITNYSVLLNILLIGYWVCGSWSTLYQTSNMNWIREQKKMVRGLLGLEQAKLLLVLLIILYMGLLYTEEQTATLHSLKLHGSTSFATTKTARPTAISISNRILSAAAAFLLSHLFPLVCALQVITSISKMLFVIRFPLAFDSLSKSCASMHFFLCSSVFILCWF